MDIYNFLLIEHYNKKKQERERRNQERQKLEKVLLDSKHKFREEKPFILEL